ncbi:hypothetical protein [Streptomyces sp. NPDC056061]|uniref:hypothetical protein n=1 Tax=Streptomyces sp. NPDC056061 TaxID=3345700 RepID=UPI0035E0CE1F
MILLDGPAGIGRRASAIMLLTDAMVDGGRIEELPPHPGDDTFDIRPADRYLLDLSDVSDEDYPSVQRALLHRRWRVEECGARMVVVLPAGLGRMLDADLVPRVVSLERPSARHVFSRYLRVHGVTWEPSELNTDELTRVFATAPMRELARLAALVARARDTSLHGAGFAEWRESAVSAATTWSDEVAEQLRKHRSVPERSLLLAAAMAEGASAEAVQFAADRLLDVLEHPRDHTPTLGRAGLGERLRALDIERGDDGRVGFTGLAYGSAVRRHFWENFPEARPDFRDWVGQCVELPEFGAEDRTRLVVRFAERALAAGRPGDLCELVERWTVPSARGPFRAEATTALEAGLCHERHGSYVRGRVYDWIVRAPLRPALAAVLTDVCVRVIAATHSEQAMVGLLHLVRRQEGVEAAAARSALLTLARGSRELFRRLSEHLVNSASSPGPGPDILLELLDPVELRITPPRSEYTLARRAVMRAGPVAVWTRPSVPIAHVAALVDELGLEEDVRNTFIRRLVGMSVAGRRDAADGTRRDLLHAEGDVPVVEAATTTTYGARSAPGQDGA